MQICNKAYVEMHIVCTHLGLISHPSKHSICCPLSAYYFTALQCITIMNYVLSQEHNSVSMGWWNVDTPVVVTQSDVLTASTTHKRLTIT
jgi:hypothetical protein